MQTEETPKLDLGSFDFTPDWAKKDAGVSVGRVRAEREFAERKPPAERKNPAERKKFAGGPRSDAPRAPQNRGNRPFQPAERVKPLEAEVKILPETKALGTIIRKLQQDFHAYKLKDLAYFFLDNPSSVLLRVSPRPGADGKPAISFTQCKVCGFAALSADEVAQHILTTHLSDYYDVKEIDCEPPKGNFNCVARCGLSGVLLGPPNIHEFNGVVREMIRTRYPNLSEEQYRAHIEMVRDADTIEAWRQGAVKKTVFLAKGAGDAALPLTREAAEGEFRRTILLSLLETPKQLMITADVAMKSPVKALQLAVRQALEAERRTPYNMCFALRGAFHHRKLKFFRANDARGPEFVTGIELKPFDADHAIPELAKVARFIADNPCSPKVEIAPDAETEKHLAWLVSTGHVVAFTNGVHSAVEKFPKYGPQWQKRKAKAPAPEATVEAPAAEATVEAPAAEAPVQVEPAAEAPAAAPAAAPAEQASSPAPAASVDEVSEMKDTTNEASAQLAE